MRDGRIHLGALELRQDLAFAHHVARIDAHLLDEAADLEAEPDLVARCEGADGAGLLRDRGARDRFGPHGRGRRDLRRDCRVGLRPAAAPCQGQRQGGHERQPTGNDAHRKGSAGDRRDVPIAYSSSASRARYSARTRVTLSCASVLARRASSEFGLVDLAEVALAARDLEGAAGRLRALGRGAERRLGDFEPLERLLHLELHLLAGELAVHPQRAVRCSAPSSAARSAPSRNASQWSTSAAST